MKQCIFLDKLQHDGELSLITDTDMKRQKCDWGMRKHTQSLWDIVACRGIDQSQSMGTHLTADFTTVSLPHKATIADSLLLNKFLPNSETCDNREHIETWGNKLPFLSYFSMTFISTSLSLTFGLNAVLQYNLWETPWVESQIKPISHLLPPFAPIRKPFKVCSSSCLYKAQTQHYVQKHNQVSKKGHRVNLTNTWCTISSETTDWHVGWKPGAFKWK